MNGFSVFERQINQRIGSQKLFYFRIKLLKTRKFIAFFVLLFFSILCVFCRARAGNHENFRVTQSQIRNDVFDAASITPPINPIDIIVNIREIYKNGYPLKEDFYNSNELNKIFGFSKFSTEKVENGKSDIISRASDNPSFLNKTFVDGHYPTIYITTGIKYKKISRIHAFLYLGLESWRPSLDELEGVFGSNWRKIILDYYDGSPPPPKAKHGDETLLFEFEGPSFRWSVTAELDENAYLKNLNMYEESN